MLTRSLALFALAAFCGSSWAQNPASVRDQLFAETDAVRKQADELNARMLAPETYAAGSELYVEASDGLERGRDLERVRRNLAEAKEHFARSVEVAQLARTTFADVLTARSSAERAESARYAERDWNKAEAALVDAAATLEGGNLKKATRAAPDVESRYRATESKALAAKTRATAR